MSKQLSQYKPSPEFVELFGPLPTRPNSGENYWDFRARKVGYQQHIRDWDQVRPIEDPEMVLGITLDHYDVWGLTPTFFTSQQRPGIHLTMAEVPGMDIWENIRIGLNPMFFIVPAQAKMISNGIKPVAVFPNPGLQKMYRDHFNETPPSEPLEVEPDIDGEPDVPGLRLNRG